MILIASIVIIVANRQRRIYISRDMTKFEDKVRAMSGKEIVMAMVNGLKKEWVKVDMATFGTTDSCGTCYGCAATNAVCEIAQIKPKYLDDGSWEDDAKIFNSEPGFLEAFEAAIDKLRMGDIIMYNSIANKMQFSKLKEVHDLPELHTDNYLKNLQAYIDYADSMPS